MSERERERERERRESNIVWHLCNAFCFEILRWLCEFLLVLSVSYKTLEDNVSVVCNTYQLCATLHVCGTLENRGTLRTV